MPTELRVHSDPGGLADLVGGRVPSAWFTERLQTYWGSRKSTSGKSRGLTRFLPQDEYERAVRRFSEDFEADPNGAAAALVETLVAGVCHGGRRWVEMSPPNCAAAGELLGLFPRARFIHVVRSGLDVACSYRAMPWAPDDLREGMLMWTDRTVESARGMQRVLIGAAPTVHFEDLVEDPVLEMVRIAPTLGLSIDGLRLKRVARTVDPARAHVGRWRQEVTTPDEPVLLALYLRGCRRLARIDGDLLPRDVKQARARWLVLPRRRRLVAATRARIRVARWRIRGRRRWSWRPNWRLRVRARLQ